MSKKPAKLSIVSPPGERAAVADLRGALEEAHHRLYGARSLLMAIAQDMPPTADWHDWGLLEIARTMDSIGEGLLAAMHPELDPAASQGDAP